MAEENVQKLEDHKAYVSGIFSRMAPDYDRIGPRIFSYFGARLVAFGAPSPGDRVLDVACGKGAVLLPAATAVAPDGEVIGIDLAEGMLAQIAGEIARRRIANASVARMDAERLDFADASFDVVLCGLGIFWCSQPERALAEFYRVLRPGGRLALSSFQTYENDLDDEITALADAYEAFIRPAPFAERRKLETASEINETLTAAGFTDVEIVPESRTFYLADEAEWWQWAWSVGFRSLFERIDPAAAEAFKRRLLEVVGSHRTEQGIPDVWPLFFTRARKGV